MTELRPCPSCQRHVAIVELACPFCTAAIAPRAPHEVPLGRLSRAAVFAGAALTATACGGKAKPVEEHHVEAAAPIDAGVTPDAAKPVDQREMRHHGGGGDHNNPMPYGAPPARRRLV